MAIVAQLHLLWLVYAQPHAPSLSPFFSYDCRKRHAPSFGDPAFINQGPIFIKRHIRNPVSPSCFLCDPAALLAFHTRVPRLHRN